jgi:hypothetical protein
VGVLCGYVDASGTETDGAVLVAVGAIAAEDSWKDFDSRWTDEMEEEFGVASFHMNEFAHLHGPFANGWRVDREKRARFLAKLTDLANETVDTVEGVALVLDHYRRVNRVHRITEAFGGPYAMAQLFCVEKMLDRVVRERDDAARYHAFVERGDVGRSAFRKTLQSQFGALASHVTVVAKGDDGRHDMTPFHLPDFVAYEYRKKHGLLAGTGRLPDPPREAARRLKAALHPDVKIVEAQALLRVIEALRIPRR